MRDVGSCFRGFNVAYEIFDQVPDSVPELPGDAVQEDELRLAISSRARVKCLRMTEDGHGSIMPQRIRFHRLFAAATIPPCAIPADEIIKRRRLSRLAADLVLSTSRVQPS
jgi:hypothetical protein